MSLLQSIKDDMNAFSKGQKRIANYILENYDKAAFMTAAKLGAIAQVSESTVVRFASELGYDGYPEMQNALQELVRSRLTSVQRMQVPQNRLEGQDILTSVMQRDADSIRTTISGVDRDEFARVVDKLHRAGHIYILGVRSSSFLAGYLNFYFHLIFKNVIYVQNTAAGEIYEQLVHIGKGDVLVGISFPRYSKMVIHAVAMAHERGADVIAITDSKASPLCEVASAALFVPCEAISFVDSMAAPMSLLNALILAVCNERMEDVSATFAQLERVWTKYSIFGKEDE